MAISEKKKKKKNRKRSTEGMSVDRDITMQVRKALSCPNCGKQIESTDRVCPRCGTRL